MAEGSRVDSAVAVTLQTGLKAQGRRWRGRDVLGRSRANYSVTVSPQVTDVLLLSNWSSRVYLMIAS
jgi:hypothetical protein